VKTIALYEIVARARGVDPHQLPLRERAELFVRAARVMDPSFELTPNSERGDPIELVPYDAGWPARFESWKSRLSTAVDARRIDHIGSTAIPGLAAKPTIDIQVSVDDVADEAGYVPAMESLGLQLRNRDSEHRYLRPLAGLPRDVHVHVCRAGSVWERRHLLFVAFLRASEDARREYLHAKLQALEEWGDDRVAYTEAKDDVIASITHRAEEWAQSSGWMP
jgi:GrpB-like predicted nucleotidyltransferase (UPF0157 family)